MRILVGLVLVAACGGSSDPAVCGDGEVYADTNDPLRFEECDDGNAIDGDGCSQCVRDAVCGDGTVDILEDCDDGNTASGDGCSATCDVEQQFDLAASWTFRTVASAQPTDCPSGFDTVRVVSQPLDAGGNPAGSPTIDIFSCASASGIAPLAPARYRVHLDVTNAAGTNSYAQSVARVVDLRTSGASFAASIVKDGGYFSFAWMLRGATSNNVLTCAQAGSASVSLLATVTTSTEAVEDLFTCSDGAGVTAALLAGTYVVSISALDNGEAAVGTAPALANRVIQAPNKVTDLGTVTIPIDGL
jgi:cysteine-rich repeat protein